jgi:DnaJ-class molecular chaperone
MSREASGAPPKEPTPEEFQTVYDAWRECSACEGLGYPSTSAMVKCHECNGTGELLFVSTGASW